MSILIPCPLVSRERLEYGCRLCSLRSSRPRDLWCSAFRGTAQHNTEHSRCVVQSWPLAFPPDNNRPLDVWCGAFGSVTLQSKAHGTVPHAVAEGIQGDTFFSAQRPAPSSNINARIPRQIGLAMNTFHDWKVFRRKRASSPGEFSR